MIAIAPNPQERRNLEQAVDYTQVSSLPELWAIAAQRFANLTAVKDPHSQPKVELTYSELYHHMQRTAAALQSLGLQSGEHVAFFADNCARWMIMDQGIMMAGCVDAVRGSQADTEELLFILKNSDSVGLVVQDRALLAKLQRGLEAVSPPLKFVVLLSDEATDDLGHSVLNFSQLLALGESVSYRPTTRTRDQLATLMYTSGTSGMPKGVMLSHGNILHEVTGASAVVRLIPGHRVLSILPIWHSYERTFEYFVFSQGCTQVYTNIRTVKKDLKTEQPHYMVAVPRLWESIYDGIQKQFREQPPKKQNLVQFFLGQSQRYLQARRTLQDLDLNNLTPSPAQKLGAVLQLPWVWLLHQVGDRLVYRKVREGLGGQIEFVVSGGGSIAEHLEDFYEIVGIEILGGYGLTETAPITHVRRPWRNLRGADGQPLLGTETRIVSLESRQDLPLGDQGLILIRGPQVMQGYYQNPTATTKAIDPEGWFDTGDLGWMTPQGDLIISGRAKDTIVLTNGENIEPQPIEDACLRSDYIDQIMLLGQDQKYLGALIVPNLDALRQWAVKQKLPLQFTDPADLAVKEVQELVRQELNREVKNRPGYRPDDRIAVFRLITEPFTVDNGLLTQTLKIRRHLVTEHYRAIIDEIFA